MAGRFRPSLHLDHLSMAKHSLTSQLSQGVCMFKLNAMVLCTALVCSSSSIAQTVRKYDDKSAPPFKVLNEGENPPLDANGNFVIGPM